MAVYADRVRETTTTSGLGAYALNGAVGGFRSFSSAIVSGSTVVYCVEDGTGFEVGEGTLTVGTPNTISRTTVLSSSNNNQLVSWGAGTKNIFLTAAAARTVTTDRANTLTGPLNLPTNGLAVGASQLVTSAGNVGIGTSSPTALLHLSTPTTTDTVIRLDRNNTERASVAGVFDGLLLNGAQVVRLSTGSTERVRIDANGNVGVGTSSPGAAVDVANGAMLRITNDAASLRLRSSTTPTNYGEVAIDSSGTTYFTSQTGNVFLSAMGAAGQVLFRSGGGVERMRIDASGNVGIGTSSPSSKLEVSNGANSNGALKVSTTGTAAGNFASMNFVTGTAVWTAGTEASNGRFFIYSNAASRDQLSFSGGTNSDVTLTTTGTGTFRFNTGSTERLRIDTNGNLGIGTTTPSAQGLSVLKSGATDAGVQVGNGTASTYLTQSADGNFYLYNYGAYGLILGTSGVEKMRLDASGNLGIGTTPAYKLDVDHGGSPVRFRNGTTGYGSIALGGSATATNNYQLASDGSGNFIIYRGNPGAGTERLRVDTNGNLGVGTTAPTNYTGSGYGSIAVNGTTGGILEFQGAGTQAARITGWSNSLAIHTNNVERLRIDSNGNLALGASSTTARLLIQGSGAQETAVVQHGGTNHSIINLNQSDALGTNPSFRPILSLRKGGTTSFNLSVDGSTQGLTYFEAYSATAALVFVTNSVERARIDSSGNVLITGNGGLGYGTGSGGAVTQITSKATGVTLNKPNGTITLNAAALAANTTVSFTLTSSSIAATDVVHVQRVSGGTAGAYNVWCDSVAAGSCVICVRNISAGSLSEAVVLQFVIHKSVAA